jgi:predicted CoA-binding protein
MTETPSDDLLRRVLREVKSFACVGVSPNPVRPSHYVARYLKLKGYRVIPVNPGQAGHAVRETVRADLGEVTRRRRRHRHLPPVRGGARDRGGRRLPCRRGPR